MSCFCTGICKELGYCPNHDRTDLNPSKIFMNGYFEKVAERVECKYPEHNPPMHIAIPSGYRYIHICPKCGANTVMQDNMIQMKTLGG